MKIYALTLFLAIILVSGSAYADEGDDYKSYPNSKCSFLISIDGTMQSDGTRTLDCMTQSGVGTEAATYAFTQNDEQIVFAGPPAMSIGDSLIVSQVTIGGTQLGASGTCNGKFSGNMNCVVSLKGGRGTIQVFSKTMGPANPVPTAPEPPALPPEPAPGPEPERHQLVDPVHIKSDPHTLKMLQMTPTACNFDDGHCKYSYYQATDIYDTSIIFDGGDGKALSISGKLDSSGSRFNIDSVILFLNNYKFHSPAGATGYCNVTTGNNADKYECNVSFSNQNLSITAEGPTIKMK